MNHALDLRATGGHAAIARLRAALDDPHASADLLADVLNDAGTRDALLAIAAASGRWDDVAPAAAAGGLAAAATGRSVHGPLTVLAAARLVRGDSGTAAAILRQVPPDDDAHRFADLLQRTLPRPDLLPEWTARIAALDIGTCLAYHRPATPPGAPPPDVERWFAPPPPDRRADAWARLGVGYSSSGTAAAAGDGPGFAVPHGPADLLQILARTGETAAGACLIIADIDPAGRLRHVHRIDDGLDAAPTALAAAAALATPGRPQHFAVVACGGQDRAATAVTDELGRLWAPTIALDTLQVQPDGRWTSLACIDPACCPTEGRAAPDDPLLGWQLDDALTGAAAPAADDPLVAADPLAADPLSDGTAELDGPAR